MAPSAEQHPGSPGQRGFFKELLLAKERGRQQRPGRCEEQHGGACRGGSQREVWQLRGVWYLGDAGLWCTSASVPLHTTHSFSRSQIMGRYFRNTCFTDASFGENTAAEKNKSFVCFLVMNPALNRHCCLLSRSQPSYLFAAFLPRRANKCNNVSPLPSIFAVSFNNLIDLILNDLHSSFLSFRFECAAATMAHLGTAHCPQHVRQDKPIRHPFNYSVDRKLGLYLLPWLCCGPDYIDCVTLKDSSEYSPFFFFKLIYFYII